MSRVHLFSLVPDIGHTLYLHISYWFLWFPPQKRFLEDLLPQPVTHTEAPSALSETVTHPQELSSNHFVTGTLPQLGDRWPGCGGESSPLELCTLGIFT